jgi:ATP-dependent exoDNAse (exonuclease V) alpha subunit
VELTEVYRNQGIVLENAHNILNGRSLVEDKDFRVVRGKRDIQLGQERMSTVVYNMLRTMTESIGDDGLPEYDVENDIILSPFNVQPMGTENMNKWIAQFEGEKRDAVVHEIIAGRQKLYLAVGDKVMVNKRDGVIKDIFPNPAYYGKQPQLAGKDLSRFGHRMLGKDAGLDFEDMAGDLNYENFSLEALAEEKMERKQQASHCVIVDYGDDYEEEVSAVGDFSEACFSLGYCLTVYKAQGSEWRKVIFLMHKDHAVGLFRESFYTAVTRARTKVDIIGKDYLIERTIKSQRIKGNTLKDKLAFFNSGINNTVDVQVIK